VPVLLSWALWPSVQTNVPLAAGLTIVIVSASLYISSLCRSSVRAAVTALTVIPGVLWVVLIVVVALRPGPLDVTQWSAAAGGWWALTLFVTASFLSLAFVNHGPEPPTAARITAQVLALVLMFGTGIVVLTMLAP
jgi:hypothetical protein